MEHKIGFYKMPHLKNTKKVAVLYPVFSLKLCEWHEITTFKHDEIVFNLCWKFTDINGNQAEKRERGTAPWIHGGLSLMFEPALYYLGMASPVVIHKVGKGLTGMELSGLVINSNTSSA